MENKNFKLKIMWYESIQSTFKFFLQLTLIMCLIVYGCTNHGVIGFIVSGLILIGARIRSPSVVYEHDYNN